jgi:two-component sensor histidine kinase
LIIYIVKKLRKSSILSRLRVKDDRVGMPAFITYNALKALGIQLVSDVVYRLGSSVEIDQTQWATVVIEFREMQYRKRL